MPPIDLLSPRNRHARGLFADLPPTYERMARRLSLGQDARWRRFLVSRVRASVGWRVLDVATGTGAVARELSARTGAQVVGLDQSEPMVRAAVAEAARPAIHARVRFVIGQGERLPFPDGAFDAVTFTYLLRYVDDPASTLGELARVLRPEGILAGLEFHVPSASLWRALWLAYTRAGLPIAGGLVSRAWFEVGRFLGPSISEFYRRHPLEQQLQMWRAAGVGDVRARVMSLGGGVVTWGIKRGR